MIIIGGTIKTMVGPDIPYGYLRISDGKIREIGSLAPGETIPDQRAGA